MLPFFSYIHSPSLSLFFFSLLFLLISLSPLPAGTALYAEELSDDVLPDNVTWRGLLRFINSEKGARVQGMVELKRYFSRFGYLPHRPENMSFNDIFDDEFQTALLSYQKNLGLSLTGMLDSETMRVIVSPRCGVSDTTPGGGGKGDLKTTRRYAYFYGQPRWVRPSPMTLTYAFSAEDMIDYVSPSEVRAAFGRAFERWAAVIPLTFRETEDYVAADIRIGWYRGDHGDGQAFDGVLGVLAHAFSPENGRFHLDAAERWSVDFAVEKGKSAVDLESVATHEIGHVLGLAHSSVKDSIMYPSLGPRTKKVELRKDDVVGIQALYGSNPNYKYDSRMESDTSSSGRVMDLEMRKGLMKLSATMIVVAWLFSLGL